MRLAVVGDIHGHREELEATLTRLESHQVDRIVLLGDLFDRGPDPFGCLDIARYWTFTARSGRARHLEVVMGNHEDSYVRERKGIAKPGKTVPAVGGETSTSKGLTRDEHEWLAALPYVIEEPRLGVLCVHGGVTPAMTAREHLDERVLRARYLTPEGTAIDGFTFSDTHWSDVYDGRFGFVVYGHESWEKPRVRRHSLGLDGEGRGFVHAAILTNERSGLTIARTITTPYKSRWSFMSGFNALDALEKPVKTSPLPAPVKPAVSQTAWW